MCTSGLKEFMHVNRVWDAVGTPYMLPRSCLMEQAEPRALLICREGEGRRQEGSLRVMS